MDEKMMMPSGCAYHMYLIVTDWILHDEILSSTLMMYMLSLIETAAIDCADVR